MSADGAAAGRSGYLLLATIVAFVFFWLDRNAPGDLPAAATADIARVGGLDDDSSAGFRADAWLLPDEALLGFVEIPAGAFIMGSDPRRDPMAYANERWSAQSRQGNPHLPGFYIGRYEVTVAQFNRFADSSGRVSRIAGGAAHPATGVTWPEALAYARWLDGQMRLSPATPAALRQALEAGWRISLPSEAQWEKAARGVGGRVFPWGLDPAAGNANFGGGALRAVTGGDCPQCSHGLADMAGNVWEMTSSPLRDYPFDSGGDAAATGADALFVMRGGSHLDGANNVRAAVRGAVDPGARSAVIGFRLAIAPP